MSIKGVTIVKHAFLLNVIFVTPSFKRKIWLVVFVTALLLKIKIIQIHKFIKYTYSQLVVAIIYCNMLNKTTVRQKPNDGKKFLTCKMNESLEKAIEVTKETLKNYYNAQDKLVPLFDDTPQSISNCYIRLALLTQQQFQERKEKMTNKNNEEKKRSKEDNENREEDGKWQDTIDYSLIYNEQKTIELEDIWNTEKSKKEDEKVEEEEEMRHINVHGEAGTGKSVLSQRIAYLWANKQMWNNRFQLLLHIPLRKIASIFDKTKEENNKIEKQWSKVMTELNIPKWNTDDTKCIMHANNRLLLVLDGFDEIANELNTKPGLRQWLQHCILNTNYSIIMTSHPNAMCSYLNNKLRRLNLIGFQRQDIQNYVHAYFQNITNDDSNYQADVLIKTLNNNPSLQLLSHTPLYLRLLCYLARQEINARKDQIKDKIINGLNNMPVPKLYEKLLECYMKWNWTKLNGIKENTNEQNIFNIFKMEIDYLSHLAWEGLKLGQPIISCEIQEKSLNWIKMKYPRKCIAIPSQWSRIHSFGFLQGQELMNPSHPINSVYFPHLTFQEWFAAYYLVHCLYQPTESDDHKQVCSILINEQLNPKYSMMIPFMAGILYDNIESKKDSSGSGLLYFWKLLHSPSLSQLSYIHRMIFHMRCLDVCKADTESPFLSSQLQNCHKNLIDSFKSFLIAWINFDKKKDGGGYKIVDQPFDKVIRQYLSNLRHVRVHPDIHLCIVDQLELVCKQLKNYENIKLIIRLNYLSISPQTSKIVMRYLQQGFQDKCNFVREMCVDTVEQMILKMSETQMDDIFEVLLDGFCNRDKYVHEKCANLIEKILSDMNTEQLSSAFKRLIDTFNNKKIHLCNSSARILTTFVVKLDTKQMDYALNYVISEAKDTAILESCAILFETIAMKSNEVQLNNIFKSLLSALKSGNQCHHRLSVDLLEKISLKLDERQQNSVFEYLMNGLQDKRKVVRQCCVKLIKTLLGKWNQIQLNNSVMCLIKNGFKCENDGVRYVCAQTIQKLKWNKKQLSDDVFNCLMNGFKNDPSKNVQYLCAESIGKISMKLNNKQLNIAWEYLNNGLNDKNEDMLVRMSCAESLGRIAMKLNRQQLKDSLECLMNKVNNDNENAFVQKYCAYSLERVVLNLNKMGMSKLAHKLSIQSLEMVLIKYKEKKFDNIISYLIHGLKNKDKVIYHHYVESFVNLLTELNKKQLNAKNYYYMEHSEDCQLQNSCLKILDIISSKLNDQQLDNIIYFLKSGFSSADYSIQHSCKETLRIISATLSEQQMDDIFEFLMSGINNKYEKFRASCVRGLEIIALKLNKTQLNHLLKWSKNNFEDTNCWVRSFCRQIYGIMFIQLNEQQKDDLFEFLSNGLNNKSGDILQSYADTIQKIVLQLNTTQLNKLFDYYDSYIRVLRKIALQLDETKLDEFLQFLKERFNCCDNYVHLSYIKVLETILSKLSKRQKNAFQFLLNGFNNEHDEIHNTCAKKRLLKLNGAQLSNSLSCLKQKRYDNLEEIFEIMLSEWNEPKVDDTFESLLKGINCKNTLRLSENQRNDLLDCLKKGFNDKDYNVLRSCEKLLEKISSKLDDRQLDDIIRCLKNRFDKVGDSCENILQTISSKLNKRPPNEAFECLRSGSKDNDIWFFILCAELIQSLSEGFDKQTDSSLKFWMDGSNDSNSDLYNLCTEALQIIALKLNEIQLKNLFHYLSIKWKNVQSSSILEIISSSLDEQQIDNVFESFIDGLNTKSRDVCISSVRGLKVIALRLNKKQLESLFHCLKSEFMDNNSKMMLLCADILRKLASNWNDQLDDLLECLEYGLRSEYDQARYSCEDTLRTILAKVGEQQMDHMFTFLINGFNHFDKNVSDSCAKVLETIVMKLNDEQLRLLINNFLKEFKDISMRQYNKVNSVLSKISDDMWQRVIITTLKKNMKIKIGKNNDNLELLAFGLLSYNPLIQSNHNDNENIINCDAFNELRRCYNRQIIRWGFPIQQAVHKAAELGDVSQLKSALEYHHIDINDAFNEHGQTPLHIVIHNRHWDVVRYCIEQGAWIDVCESYLDTNILQIPCEYISELIEREKDEVMGNKKEYLEIVDVFKWMLKKRTIYPMKQIEYAIGHVNDKSLNEDGTSKFINTDNHQTLLLEGASFLLGMDQNELRKMLIIDYIFYWAVSRNVVSIKPEYSNQKRYNGELRVRTFLKYRIFLLFEICVGLKQERNRNIKLPRNATFEQVYEKGMKELQVQLTTYWDYITGIDIHYRCPDLLDDWSLNVVDRLIHSKEEYYEISLMVGNEDHAIYLSLCKTLDYILVRIDNRSMETVPFNTPHPKNKDGLIQPYLVAYFLCNSVILDKNKEWLRDYVKYTFAFRNEKSDQSMRYLYCSDIHPPHEGELPSIVKDWPYCPVQTSAGNCYLRNHNVGYQIRLGNIYKWFRSKECKKHNNSKNWNIPNAWFFFSFFLMNENEKLIKQNDCVFFLLPEIIFRLSNIITLIYSFFS
ncbi:hypothetical protein RFI_03214 [Reticulomyxa filosa]|uniref:NACHT domain-containing protein n=1 Tax=Reticulomyxa filosa TaxID=46433 RepID=X6P8D3_RETFI|nr:hypothetical protein RFI_03214 [Reticulomyxa filosa]|eukprot:ETO33882.1 hypothetical protein RFI_03214 [Reticulomyxa filosa]